MLDISDLKLNVCGVRWTGVVNPLRYFLTVGRAQIGK